MPPGPRPAAVLFDIDGTLLQGASTMHLAGMAHAMEQVTGRRPVLSSDGPVHAVDGRAVMGLTDRGVFELMCQGADVDPAGLLAELTEVFVAHYRPQVTANRASAGQVTTGAHHLLARLQELGVPVALVTGNHHEVARAKLEAAGLAWAFTFRARGGFGSATNDRAALAERALGLLSVPAGPAVWLVGDTSRDVAAARAHGLRAVLVGDAEAAADRRVVDLGELVAELG